MQHLVEAINDNNPEAISSLFISRDLFLTISDCEPDNVVEDVMAGRNDAMDRARRPDDGRQTQISNLRLFDGRLMKVAKGQKPERCRAKENVQLFQTYWSWQVDGSEESGEAHLLLARGSWHLAKL